VGSGSHAVSLWSVERRGSHGDSTYIIGTVEPGSPADPTDEAARLTNLIALQYGIAPVDPGYTYLLSGNSFGTPLPAVSDSTDQIPQSSTAFTISLGTGGLDSRISTCW